MGGNARSEIRSTKSPFHSRTDRCRKMCIFDNHNYKLYRTFLRFFGLWPHDKTKCEHIRAICFYILFVSNMVVQVILILPYFLLKCRSDVYRSRAQNRLDLLIASRITYWYNKIIRTESPCQDCIFTSQYDIHMR